VVTVARPLQVQGRRRYAFAPSGDQGNGVRADRVPPPYVRSALAAETGLANYGAGRQGQAPRSLQPVMLIR